MVCLMALHQISKNNGLLLGCPVLEESGYDLIETLQFPEKSGDALMVYLDTWVEVGLAFLEKPETSKELS